MLFTAVVLMTGCVKRDYYDDDYDNWGNNEEYGKVTYISEVNSPYSVVRMNADYQYAVVYSTDNNVKLWPEEGDVLYGDFTVGGNRKIYNKTIGKNITLEVDEFFYNENDAIQSVIRKEDSEGYVSAFKKTLIKVQRRVDNVIPNNTIK